MLRAVMKHQFMELQQDFLQYGHVVEVQTAGSTMIFTDEPEIFKAVMSSKVCQIYLLPKPALIWRLKKVFEFWKGEDTP